MENSTIEGCGALIYCKATHRYLFLLRNSNRYRNSWGLAGGKVEKGETVFQALKRELQEELGIDIESSEELTVLEHDYPHAYVRLYVSIIRNWTGTPLGCEGQALSWQSITSESPSVEPLLPAAWPMLECLRRYLA